MTEQLALSLPHLACHFRHCLSPLSSLNVLLSWEFCHRRSPGALAKLLAQAGFPTPGPRGFPESFSREPVVSALLR